MPSKTSNSELSGACDAFVEALDGFICGLISLERLRVTIATLLDGNFEPAEDMQETLDATLREGYLDKSAYIVLSTVIDLVISEDEPTESPWPEADAPINSSSGRTLATSDVCDANSSTELAPAAMTQSHSEDVAPAVAAPMHNEDDSPDAVALMHGEDDPPAAVMPTDSEENLPAAVTLKDDGDDPPAEMSPGMILRDRFTLLEQIGIGSMGQIFKAVDRRKEESGSPTPWVAIKSITEALSNPPNAPVALQKEAANAQRLSHPNIIRVFDFDRDGDLVFMTMELLEGESLTELLNEHRFRPLPGEQARAIIEGLCQGLIYAHELGIVHADVKPGNVFVTHDGNTKLLDFGISLATNDLSQKSDVYAHTPSYASYEVLEGAEPEAQDDVYSLACVAYRILAGHRAYGGATAHAAATDNLKLKPIENLSAYEWEALQNAMAFRRADRTEDVRSFLCAFTGPSEISNGPELDEAEETHQPEPFMPLSRIAGGCAALFAIVAITAAIWTRPHTGVDYEAAEITKYTLPALTKNTNPADIGPPIALRASDVTIPEVAQAEVAAVLPIQPPPKERPAVPSRPRPKINPIDELAKKASASLDQRFLLEPTKNSAKLYISKMQALDAKSNEFIQARQRFSDLMMLEVMVAIADEEFVVADELIAETKAVGVASASTERYEVALAKAREAKISRDSASWDAIFTSTRPAAVLASPAYSQIPDFWDLSTPLANPDATINSSPARPAEPAMPTSSAAREPEMPETQTIDSSPETLPLSAFQFKRRVQPKYPPRAASRKLAGWVELRFLVNAQGKTESIQVTGSEPQGSFEKAATKAISKWRFEPIMVNGLPTEKYGEVRLRFKP